MHMVLKLSRFKQNVPTKQASKKTAKLAWPKYYTKYYIWRTYKTMVVIVNVL